MSYTSEEMKARLAVLNDEFDAQHFDQDGSCSCKSNETVAALLRAAARAPICPECRSAKHGNCDGTAMDERADEIVECRCPPAFHPEKRS